MNSNAFTATPNTGNEHCKMITTRGGKVVGSDVGKSSATNEDYVVVEDASVEKDEVNDEVKIGDVTNEEKNKREKKVSELRKKKVEPSQIKECPYPLVPTKKDVERRYARFLDIFKHLQINVPFLDALEEMPTYAKFMKDLLTKKRKPKEETIELEAGCSAIIQKSMPNKSKDPGSFTIPVTIGELPVGKALLDLGASINLMPLSMMKRIGDLQVKPTKMTLQLADRSLKFPYGIAEDVLVKVDRLVFPVDFVIMDMEEDLEVPLILGRPFMKTAKVLIDVDKGKLKVRVGDDEVTFDVFEAMKHPIDKQQVYRMDVGEDLFDTGQVPIHNGDMLERALIEPQGDHLGEEQEQLNECLQQLDACKVFVPPREKFKPPIPEEKVEKSNVELKVLPPSLNSALFDDKGKKPVVVSNSLTPSEEEKSLNVFRTRDGMELYHDKKIKRTFHPGHLVLQCEPKWKRPLGKFKSRWSSPYVIKEVKPHGAIELQNPKSGETWYVNKHRLKHYVGDDDEQPNHHHSPP